VQLLPAYAHVSSSFRHEEFSTAVSQICALRTRAILTRASNVQLHV
jgi:hypothetical protein